MAAGYVPVDGAGTGSRGMSGLRLRIRPLQLLLLGIVAFVIVVPLLAGSERRARMHDYIKSNGLLNGHGHSAELSSHIAPPSGGIPDDEDVPLTLEARLKYLLHRPALDQWESELTNRHGCPMYTYSRNTYFFHEGKDNEWSKVTKDDVRRYRQKMVDYFRALEREGTALVWDKSMEAKTPANQRRGIIYTGGEGVSLEWNNTRRSHRPSTDTPLENTRPPPLLPHHAPQGYQVDPPHRDLLLPRRDDRPGRPRRAYQRVRRRAH